MAQYLTSCKNGAQGSAQAQPLLATQCNMSASAFYYDMDPDRIPRPTPRTPSIWWRAAVIIPCLLLLGGVVRHALASPHRTTVQHHLARSSPAQAVGAAIAAATLANPAAAVAPAEIRDIRHLKPEYSLAYEARDTALPHSTRAGLDQARDPAVARMRVSEAAKRLDKVGTDIANMHWPAGREELRRYVGTLRFDLSTLASSSSADAREQVCPCRGMGWGWECVQHLPDTSPGRPYVSAACATGCRALDLEPRKPPLTQSETGG